MRFKERYAAGRWWTWDEWEALRERTTSRRTGPYVISDTSDPFRSMADGRMYDSKSRYRAELRARGLEEAGNDPSTLALPMRPEPQGVEQDIKDAWDQLSAG